MHGSKDILLSWSNSPAPFLPVALLHLSLPSLQVEPKRLISDVNGTVWLRIEDAGYMDSEGRIWLVGRVKWRVERNGRTYWSTVVEQKVFTT